MDDAARHFARKILALHLLVLLVIIGAVAFAARQVYEQTREQMIVQAKERQVLLSVQTARAIREYYNSILDTLDLINRGEERDENADPDSAASPAPATLPAGALNPLGALPKLRTPLVLGPLFWQQLDGRVSDLFGLHPAHGRVIGAFPRERQRQAQDMVLQHLPWFRSVSRPTISPVLTLGDESGHLVCVPMPVTSAAESNKLLLAAAVPLREIETRFINQLNRRRSVNVTLVDEDGLSMVSSERHLVGRNLLEQGDDATLQTFVRENALRGHNASVVIREPTVIAGTTLSPRIVTGEPVTVGGRRWMLLISSGLAEVDAVVSNVFRKTIYWAVLLVISMTAVLVSTSTQMIRSRLKIERMHNDIMRRELERARKIQLAWLPQAWQQQGALTVAAANEPASHISGDFYDWFQLPDGRTVVTIGDVSGHGLPAAFLMATTQLLIRSTMQRVADPGRCLEEVNPQLCSHNFNGQFVTVLIAVLDIARGKMHLAAAGHFPPILTDGSRAWSADIEPQLVLGIEPEETYTTVAVDLPERFGMVMYTDGLVEASSARGENFGRANLIDFIARYDGPAHSLVSATLREVRHFAGRHDLEDDLTIVAIQGTVSGLTIAAAHAHSIPAN